MDTKMFCNQCEQTAGGRACTGSAGVCGKSADVAALQDALTGAVIGFVSSVPFDDAPKTAPQLISGSLFTTLTNVNFDSAGIKNLIDEVHALGEKYATGATSSGAGVANADAGADATGATAGAAGVAVNIPVQDFDMSAVWDEPNEDIKSLKTLIITGARGIAAYAWHVYALDASKMTEDVERGIYETLALAKTGTSVEELLGGALKLGELNLKCMELLESANTTAFGTPEPTHVSMNIESGPFVVVSGHDLHDLDMLLTRADARDVAVYTHGEMLPAHAYPRLREHKSLKGHFGTAWQNQQKEFDNISGAVLFTTNCLMPPRESYADRVFTTSVVSYPECKHVNGADEIDAVLDRAIELGGYDAPVQLAGTNGGTTLTTGFGKDAVLGVAPQVIDAVKAGKIKHFFLVGGCDGARAGRNYYTEFVKQTPADTVVLTLACGKFRFNDLDLGDIDGIPRLLDVGQCNDAYGAIQIALALADAFECGVNDLPLSFVLSWYEQKAVVILLTLLHLGIKNIHIGPTLPAFLSPGIVNYLVENFGVSPISTPEEDLKKFLGE